jgi:hypothetical protein
MMTTFKHYIFCSAANPDDDGMLYSWNFKDYELVNICEECYFSSEKEYKVQLTKKLLERGSKRVMAKLPQERRLHTASELSNRILRTVLLYSFVY